MRWTRRFTFSATAVSTMAAVLAFTAPANAAYTPAPISLPWHPAGPVHASTEGNGVVYLGGLLDGTGGIAALDAASGNLLWQIPADGDVRALALSPDGATLYAGGGFTAVDGVTHRRLVAIKVADHSLISTWRASAPDQVRDLVTHGNDVYVGGRLSKNATGGVQALDAATGARDTAFDFSVDSDVLGLALDGTRLILSGSFTHINGAPRNLLASINLSSNSLTDWAPAKLCSICDQYWDVQTDGTNAYVATSGNAAGAFDLTTGQQPWRNIRADGDVQALWLPGDGRVYLGGHFGRQIWSGTTAVDATVVAAVFTSTGQPDPSFTPRIYDTWPGCWALNSTPGKLWVGGNFAGEEVNGGNNHQPFLAAYPETNVVIDTQPPTGTYTAGPATAWAGSTSVQLVQQAIHDNKTPDNLITRRVDWGDGTTEAWTTGSTLSHVYQTTGTFTPTVTLTDQAGNSSGPIDATAVDVTVDRQAPTGTFTAGPATAWAGTTSVQLVQQAIQDNRSPDNRIDRRVSWGDGTTVDWTTGSTLSHVYQAAGTFTPTVTLTDEAGNSSGPISATAVTVELTGDSQPPTGTFATDTATAWAGLTRVTVVQSALHDNLTPDGKIIRQVAWGDGTTTAWTTGTTLAHVYQSGGTYLPKVTLTDEAGNHSAPIDSSAVVVTVDSAAPVVTLRLPRHHQHTVTAWRTLRGRAVDTGTGVTTVSVKAFEKRGTTWYAYHANSHRWVKAATRARAIARSTTFQVQVNARHRWHTKLAHLRQGHLVYRVWAKDQVRNWSVTVTHRADLTRH